ncbi:hypothetical protein CMQ_677 [Grosmannia clavigera kw1407]|uniref:Helix-turn-helix domain-containing protein n=1 Tax=Grosmannia clavigera (strain kw1407 / UAMH 11150) TaxID=655863 RepID=F0XE46_GROCL|nr:uncharacterized protein CMQ_677 [Grosmannia clavigera kw1407]EFX03749.1 hypothetical protein CMQ_677 [Grosmannia clavigera kw1407]
MSEADVEGQESAEKEGEATRESVGITGITSVDIADPSVAQQQKSPDEAGKEREAMMRALNQGDALLWNNPIGWDVVVICGFFSWRLHRQILDRCEYFSPRIEPWKSREGDKVISYFGLEALPSRCLHIMELHNHDPGQLANVLRFLYTHALLARGRYHSGDHSRVEDEDLCKEVDGILWPLRQILIKFVAVTLPQLALNPAFHAQFRSEWDGQMFVQQLEADLADFARDEVAQSKGKGKEGQTCLSRAYTALSLLHRLARTEREWIADVLKHCDRTRADEDEDENGYDHDFEDENCSEDRDHGIKQRDLASGETEDAPYEDGIEQEQHDSKSRQKGDTAHDETKVYARVCADKLKWDQSPLQADTEDCQEDHYFNGMRLPPVGDSLKEVVAYLSQQNVYKDEDWPVRVKFIEAHLDFLEEVPLGDGDSTQADQCQADGPDRLLPLPPPQANRQPPVYGQNTRMLVQEARRLVRLQRLFEAHQYNIAKQATVLHSPAAISTMQPRELQFSSLLCVERVKSDAAGTAIPRSQQLAPNADIRKTTDGSANDILRILKHYPDATSYYQQLAADDGHLMGQPAQPGESIDTILQRAQTAVAAAEAGGQNLAYGENAEFYQSVIAQRGWAIYSRDGSSATVHDVRRLPDGTMLGQDATSYARERGARRAALQLALVEFSSSENTAASNGSPWCRVALPVPARNIYRRTAAAGGCWPWATKAEVGAGMGKSTRAASQLLPVPKLVAGGSRGDTEEKNMLPVISKQTHPYTAYMAEYRRHRIKWVEKARMATESENQDQPDWAVLPRFPDAYSLGYGSPRGLPRRPLPRLMEQDRRMLVLLRSIARLLERALEVAPRPLLRNVRKYTAQGLRGLSQPDSALQLRSFYDWEPRVITGLAAIRRLRVARPINEVEARWLNFLLTGSTNSRLMLPLPAGPDLREAHEKEEEGHSEDRGGQALYQCFAQRLQGLMDDLSDIRLFQTVDTEVPIKVLVDTMNEDGAPFDVTGNEQQQQQRVRFSYGDARFFCDRLRKAGRCRFSPYKPGSGEGNRGGGIVQRPRLTLHPEHRIWAKNREPPGGQEGWSWLMRPHPGADEQDPDIAIGAPQRALEVDDTWAKTVASGRTKEPLRAEVHDFFCGLAFRFGRTLRQLEMVERGRWEDAAWKQADSASDDLNATQTKTDKKNRVKECMSAWQQKYENMTSKNNVNCGFPDVVRIADPEATKSSSTMPAKYAQDLIAHKLLVEAERALTPLPTAAAPRPSGSLWDWALPQVCGLAPQFFHIDRWPVHLQTPAVEQYWTQQNDVLDPEAVWDPASEDPTPAKYMWRPSSSASAFGFQKETKYVGPVAFLHGETKLQQLMVIDDITERVATALEAVEERGMWSKLSERVPFFGRRRALESVPLTFDDVVVEDTPLPKQINIMGSSASKATRTGVPRKYPTRAAGASLPHDTQRAARPARSTRPPAHQSQRAERPATDISNSTLRPERRQPSFSKDEVIRADGSDPDWSAAFSDRLRQLGAVTPNPTSPQSSAGGIDSTAAAYAIQRRSPKNTTLSVLEARRRLHDDQAAERTADVASKGRGGGGSHNLGREFLSASTLREILELRAQGVGAAVIEQRLRLKAGVVDRLGRPGLVEAS